MDGAGVGVIGWCCSLSGDRWETGVGAGDEAALRPQLEGVGGQPQPHRQLMRHKAGVLLGVADRLGDAVVAKLSQAQQHPDRVQRMAVWGAGGYHLGLRGGRWRWAWSSGSWAVPPPVSTHTAITTHTPGPACWWRAARIVQTHSPSSMAATRPCGQCAAAVVHRGVGMGRSRLVERGAAPRSQRTLVGSLVTVLVPVRQLAGWVGWVATRWRPVRRALAASRGWWRRRGSQPGPGGAAPADAAPARQPRSSGRGRG